MPTDVCLAQGADIHHDSQRYKTEIGERDGLRMFYNQNSLGETMIMLQKAPGQIAPRITQRDTKQSVFLKINAKSTSSQIYTLLEFNHELAVSTAQHRRHQRRALRQGALRAHCGHHGRRLELPQRERPDESRGEREVPRMRARRELGSGS